MTAALALAALAAAAVQDAPAAPPDADTAYEASPAHPFGRPNPDAPAELADFAFFIGEFACVDERATPDGRVRFPTIWNGRYVMNGHAIQDAYWAQGFYTSNMRIFDEAEGVWKVTFFAEPGYSTGVWSGGREGDDMVLAREVTRPDGTTATSRLTFYEISDDGFRWKGENLVDDAPAAPPFWTSDCTRTR